VWQFEGAFLGVRFTFCSEGRFQQRNAFGMQPNHLQESNRAAKAICTVSSMAEWGGTIHAQDYEHGHLWLGCA
jgi:hypothetical protein